MGDLLLAFTGLNPLWLLMSIMTGVITGFFTKDVHLDRNTIITLALYDIPFLVMRLLILATVGTVLASGSGYIGVILFNFYLLSVYLGRRVGRKWRL